jgi:hypothetical protein
MFPKKTAMLAPHERVPRGLLEEAKSGSEPDEENPTSAGRCTSARHERSVAHFRCP